MVSVWMFGSGPLPASFDRPAVWCDGADRAPSVAGLPAGGEADREAEIRVPEGLALEDSVARGGADREAVEMREEVRVRGGDRRGGGARHAAGGMARRHEIGRAHV